MNDNFGESASEVMKAMNEKLGVETATTAAESPLSNGVVEWQKTTLKPQDDTKYDADTAWAYGVVVSMFDFHHGDQGSNPGRGSKIS